MKIPSYRKITQAILLSGLLIPSLSVAAESVSLQPGTILKKLDDDTFVVVKSPAVAPPKTKAKRTPGAGEQPSGALVGGNKALSKALSDKSYHDLLDRPINAEPAFVALGLTAESSPGVSSPRELASALLSGVDDKGKLQEGMAVSVNLGKVLQDIGVNLPKWDYLDGRTERWVGTKSYLYHLLQRTTLSLATAKATSGDTKALRLAGGINMVLWDFKDERRAGGTEDDYFEKLLAKELGKGASDAELVLALREKRWAKSGMNLGWAPTWISASGSTADLVSEGSTTFFGAQWVSHTHGLESAGDVDTTAKDHANLFLLGVAARYREGEMLEKDDPKTPGKKIPDGKQDSLMVAGRLGYGSADFHGIVEAGYLRVFDSPKGDQDAWRVSGVISRKVSKNVYFVMSVGQDFGVQNELFATGSFRFGTSEGSGIEPSR